MDETLIREFIDKYLALNSNKLSLTNAFEQNIVSRMFNDPIILEININKDIISVKEF